MAGHYQILLPLLSLFLVRVDLTDLFPLSLSGRVLEVYDGDTLRFRSGSCELRLRLAKIDAPELAQPFLSGRPEAGAVARRCLLSALGRGDVVARLTGRDRYGRVLGDLDDVSYRLVRRGCATIYPHAVFRSRAEKFRFLRALKRAKASKRGLWRFGGIDQPKQWRRISKRSGYRRSRQ
jgi:endonuclease YncB( thermonuclease family)